MYLAARNKFKKFYMVSVEEAQGIIFSFPFPKQKKTSLVEGAVGHVLAESVYADRAFPPINRVAMDGIAIAFEAWADGLKSFPIQGIQAAGEKIKHLSDRTQCLEVMTGAVLPNGTDTVIRYEDLKIENNEASIVLDSLEKGQNIHRKGIDAPAGALLLESGILLSPAEIALLVAVGKSVVEVYDYPVTAVISSGDELVDVGVSPEDHEIRRSNTYAIEAAMSEMKWKGTKYHFPDNKEVLIEKLTELVKQNDVLILSGGVSKGKFDFIPQALAAAGVEQKFHTVSQRPGKPFWFGVTKDNKVVFALPGNPVSTYMCFYKYIKPWALNSLGVTLQKAEAVLKSDIHFPPPLTYFIQVKVKIENAQLMATPIPGGGSGDFANLKDVTGFLELPARRTSFKSGEVFGYIPFRQI
jgi:molybdopterin molybdotransferase